MSLAWIPLRALEKLATFWYGINKKPKSFGYMILPLLKLGQWDKMEPILV